MTELRARICPVHRESVVVGQLVYRVFPARFKEGGVTSVGGTQVARDAVWPCGQRLKVSVFHIFQ